MIEDLIQQPDAGPAILAAYGLGLGVLAWLVGSRLARYVRLRGRLHKEIRCSEA